MSLSRYGKIWLQRGEGERELGVSSLVFGRLVNQGLIGYLELPGIKRRVYSAADIAALVGAGTVPSKRERQLVEA